MGGSSSVRVGTAAGANETFFTSPLTFDYDDPDVVLIKFGPSLTNAEYNIFNAIGGENDMNDRLDGGEVKTPTRLYFLGENFGERLPVQYEAKILEHEANAASSRCEGYLNALDPDAYCEDEDCATCPGYWMRQFINITLLGADREAEARVIYNYYAIKDDFDSGDSACTDRAQTGAKISNPCLKVEGIRLLMWDANGAAGFSTFDSIYSLLPV